MVLKKRSKGNAKRGVAKAKGADDSSSEAVGLKGGGRLRQKC
jgi:hypothetical protein